MEFPKEIASAIVEVKSKVKKLGFNQTNAHGRYDAVSVDKFYENVGPIMAEAGISLIMDEISSEIKSSGKNDNPWLFTSYSLSFIHSSGAMSEPVKRSCALAMTGPQAYGAAQSYIEKQFLRQIFKIPTGEKDADDVAPSTDVPHEPRYVPPPRYGEVQSFTPPIDKLTQLESSVRTRGNVASELNGVPANATPPERIERPEPPSEPEKPVPLIEVKRLPKTGFQDWKKFHAEVMDTLSSLEVKKLDKFLEINDENIKMFKANATHLWRDMDGLIGSMRDV